MFPGYIKGTLLQFFLGNIEFKDTPSLSRYVRCISIAQFKAGNYDEFVDSLAFEKVLWSFEEMLESLEIKCEK